MSDLNEIVLNGNAYSLASQEIGDLNNLVTTDKSSIVSAINEVKEEISYIGDSLIPMATEHYRLNGNGMCSADQTAYIRKYSVTSGTLLYIKASKDFNGVFQWQSVAGVPDSGATNPKLVGDPVNNAVDGFFIVPSGALFLYVCSSVNNTTNVVAYGYGLSDQLESISEKTDELEEHLYEYSIKDRTNDTSANGIFLTIRETDSISEFANNTTSYYFYIGDTETDYVITPKGNDRLRIARTSMTKQEFESMVENRTSKTLGPGVDMDSDPNTPYVISGDGTYTALIVYVGHYGSARIDPVEIAEYTKETVSVAEENTISKIRQNFVVGSPQIYTGSILDNDNIHSLTTTDIYSIYDTLVSEHPEIITRATDIGNGADGSPIRHYIVRMQNPVLNPARDSATLDVNIWTPSYDYRSIVINAGTHGDEKASVYGVAMFIKELVESSDDWALFIKGNFILHIIPVLNIYGFNNTQRNNSNSKDINRTFLDASTEEAAALTTFIQSDPKIEIIIDSHNDPYPVGYIGLYVQNEWATPLIQMSAKIAGATKPFLTTLYNDTTKSPYMLAMIQPHTYGVALDGWAGKNGYIPCVIEAPRSLSGGNTNYGKGGNITKLLLGNVIQTLGCMQ